MTQPIPVAPAARGFFDGSRNQNAGGASPRLRPGVYPEVTVLKTHVVQGHHGLRFVVEVKVTAEPRASGETDPTGQPIKPTPLGSIGSWTADIGGQYADQFGKPEVKAFTGACLGYDLDQTNANGIEVEGVQNASCTPAQPLAGRKVATSAETKPTKGNKIVKHLWYPVGGALSGGSSPAPTVVVARPAAPTAPVSPRAALEAQGWVQHPDAAEYAFRGDDCQTWAALGA